MRRHDGPENVKRLRGWTTKYTVRVRDQRLLLAFLLNPKGVEENEQSINQVANVC